MILVIRGHIRDSFSNKKLYNFIERLYNLFPTLVIFIHTWDIFSNNISWRQVPIDNTFVTKDTIYNYFGTLRDCINQILIDDDNQIELRGRLEGKINNGNCPILGWKNHWYGQYQIFDYIYKNFNCENRLVINTRFDILNFINMVNEDRILDFIFKNNNITPSKNIFIVNEEMEGIDNIYLGNIETMYKLVHIFHYDLDNILTQFPDVENQEKLVFKINSLMFN